LAALVETDTVGIVISLSHDDYKTSVGGVQNCVGDEEREFRQKGWIYLHLFPTQRLPVLAPLMQGEQFFVHVQENGEKIGDVSIETLIRVLSQVRLDRMRRVLVLHHLMGSCPELIIKLADVFAPDKTIAWIHDLFSLCPSWAMLRNDIAFCGGPSPDSQACGGCVYGGDIRKLHLTRLVALFDTLRPDVLAPSAAALDFWCARSPLNYSRAKTAPHGSLLMRDTLHRTYNRDGRRLRVGFVGAPLYHKGWDVFEELATRHSQDARYSFFHFGAARPNKYRNIAFVRTVVSESRRRAMIEALIVNEIDVVIIWSRCYESFCFAAYESVAAGAFVLAPKTAGNVVPAIIEDGVKQGLGLDSKEQMFELFAAGSIFALAAHRRSGDFRVESGTMRYLEG
jgi:hypothetical protein